jgi:excisionase family DNA binding protein
MNVELTTEQLLLTTEQAAELLSVSRTTVYELIKQGKLRTVHIGRSCRVPLRELHRCIERLAGGQEVEDAPPPRRRPRRRQNDGQPALFAVADATEDLST